jgi:CheY-like chemotaxis protein
MSQNTVLLVEDEPDSVFFFQHVAAEHGFEDIVHVAQDGRQAMDYLEGAGDFADRGEHPLPSIVVLDLKLPRMSGFEVLRLIRTSPRFQTLIVVMLTSSAADSDVTQAYALGANAYLVKPLGLDALSTMVKAFADFWLTHNQAPALERPTQ